MRCKPENLNHLFEKNCLEKENIDLSVNNMDGIWTLEAEWLSVW